MRPVAHREKEVILMSHRHRNHRTIDLSKGTSIGGTIFLLVFCLIWIGAGIGLTVYMNHQKKVCTEKVVAEVVDNASVKTHSKKHRTSTSYAPVFEYEYNGGHYKVRSKTATKPARYSVGEKVEIKIDPSDPTRIYEPADSTPKIFIVLCFVIGGVSAFFGIFALFKTVKKRKMLDY